MKTRQTALPAPSRPDDRDSSGFPDAVELAALRAWYAGVAARPAVERYRPFELGDGKSARGVFGRIRRRLVALAPVAHRDNLEVLLDHPANACTWHAKAVAQAIEALRNTRPPEPEIIDDIAQWFAPRAVRILQAYGIATLTDLTLRIPRRRQW
ncbi:MULTISPECIES: phage integrase family protein [unclassified Paraburkholderia]|uniref:phage integrase family protein n=1 Tax=unclassified Paraburkholderia TaxID=2615204 RepID=UPI002AB2793E|nr:MULTISPECIES: phage integrase family protein [unclassified Paraburkholderia]